MPKTLDRSVDAIRTTVALNAECACDGRSTRISRAINGALTVGVGVDTGSSTPSILSGVRLIRVSSMQPAYPVRQGAFEMRRVFGFLLVMSIGLPGTTQTIHSRDGVTLPPPPVVESQPTVDDYFGTKVTDNFRWLENSKSPETRAFIDEENAYTTRYLKQARIRPQIVDDLDPLEHTTRWSIPIQRAGNYYFMKRLAGEEQASIYVRHGWTGAPAAKGKASAPKDERLIDPASFSRDPNTSVDLSDVSHDGLLVAYQVRQGGADESTIHIYSLTRKKALEDELPAGVYYSTFFAPDGKGLYYARTNAKGTLLYLHTIGTRNSDDKLIFGREFHGELLGPIEIGRAHV